MTNNVIPLKPKPTTDLKLVLIPPEETEVTPEDVKNFYKNLTNILMNEN